MRTMVETPVATPEQGRELLSGTVTFLFTDIEGSTRLLQELGDRYAHVLDEERKILRAAFSKWNGREMDTQGDSFFVAFPRAADSLQAVVEAQKALAAHRWPEGRTVRVRMGLHTGEPLTRSSGYVGIDVHRASRICSVGHGGQVLLSEATRALVVSELPQGVSLRDLGQHRLRDLLSPEHLYQLVIGDLPSDFPALNSVDAIPNNLPVQLTTFIGRETEIEEVKQKLTETRLLTLTGTGGTGKTRLSLQVAAESLDSFPDGVWLVELAKLSDPALIPQNIASMFGIREAPGRPIQVALTDYMRAKQLLLVLDNCEHLIQGCAEIADQLLRMCPQVRILASSRENMGIAGETTYRVPSLTLPSIELIPSDLMRYEAARLFVDRATAVNAHFAVTAKNASSIAQICVRLDGIPLALELAAARVQVLTVEQIASRLDDRFRLLTGGSRTALPRQQTLRATIDWSYGLLSDGERRLLRALSVFVSGCTYEAAESVGGGDEVDILDLLTRLVDKSLVAVEELEEAARYRLLETIRQYARDKLVESDEAEVVRDRHLSFFLHLSQEAEPNLSGAQRLGWFRRLETEHDNLRAALEWALKRNPEQALQMGISLHLLWSSRGSSSEGEAWLDRALTAIRAIPSFSDQVTGAHAKLLARGYMGAGRLALAHGDYDHAPQRTDQAVALARLTEDDRLLGDALGQLGLVGRLTGDLETARSAVEESIALLQKSGASTGLAMALTTRAQLLARIDGNYQAARDFLEQSVQVAGAARMPWEAAVSLTSMGELALLVRDYDQARVRYRECVELFREMGDKHFANVARSGLAETERLAGDCQAAISLYRETILTWRDLGHRGGIARCIECLAFIALENGEESRATRLLGAAEALRELCGSPMVPEERVEYDQEIERLRANLNPDRLRASWQEGRALGMDQAIAYALEA